MWESQAEQNERLENRIRDGRAPQYERSVGPKLEESQDSTLRETWADRPLQRHGL